MLQSNLKMVEKAIKKEKNQNNNYSIIEQAFQNLKSSLYRALLLYFLEDINHKLQAKNHLTEE